MSDNSHGFSDQYGPELIVVTMISAVSSTPAAAREAALQRSLIVWIVTGLAFMLLPGTFLGVWNLVSIAGEHTAASVDAAWLQAHGHAQVFGWIGTFILGIGFYSLTKMAAIPEFAVSRSWFSWALWSAGVTLRWATNLWGWHWRIALPASAALEVAGFLLFFLTVRRHRATGPANRSEASGRPVWMLLVIAGSVGFLASLVANFAVALQSSLSGAGPAVASGLNPKLLVLFTCGFPVITIWGFSARWLPVFLGLSAPDGRKLLSALALNAAGVIVVWADWWYFGTAAILAGAVLACSGLRIFARSDKPPKISGVHPSFPVFVRVAFGWMLISAGIGVAAAMWDHSGGLWGASRHALTVGFMSTMVFAIGQRVLPAFCGMRVLFSPALMFWSLALLNAGCMLRVVSEIGAYESYVPSLWPLLPVSASMEMAAVTLFAASLLLSFAQPPPHLASLARLQ
jgi:hypothetical protein